MEPCGHRCFHSVTALFRLALERDELGRGVLLGGFGVLKHLVADIVYGLDYLVRLLVTQAAEMVKAPVKHRVNPVFTSEWHTSQHSYELIEQSVFKQMRF